MFVAASDPVNSGAVESLSRPGGNATGFTTAEFGMSGKWLELLKEISPSVKKVAVLQDPIAGSASVGQFAAIQAVAPSLNVDLVSIILRDDRQIEKAVTAFAQTPDTALIATRTGAAIRYSDLIVDAFRIAGTYTGQISRATSPPTYRSNRPPRLSCSSISKPLRRFVSPCRHPCSHAPTR